MDRRFSADHQWFVSPLLELKAVKEDLLDAREDAEITIDREIDTATDAEELKKVEMEMWQNSMTLEGFSSSEAAEAISALSDLDMFLSDVGPSRNLDDMKGDEADLKKSVLFTHKEFLKRNEWTKASRQRKSQYVTSLKYDKFMMSGGANTTMYRPQCSITEKCDDDIVLIVDAIVPYNRPLQSHELRSSRLLKTQNKFLVRGDTFLSDLRQKFYCQCDTIVPLENGLELEPPCFDNSTAERFPSSFIFVHNTFYVDSAPENAQDISFPIRKFMQDKEIFDPVDAVPMEGVRIIDLSLRLGQPYVFQHSGNCEHVLIFHDLRLLHESDPRGIDQYPYVLYEKGNERKCEICKKGHVEFVVDRHELLPNTYTYFCRSCFQEYNFVHGVKTHSFNAWPYTELKKVEQNGWPFDEPDDMDDS
ncbi:hypothetical protein B9Z55_011285 [Caenorhabditis nigoni]|uniref:Uncharacterized protein n=2 Tax=Caenorhabditis nigoni TaxID=1611254 RepID=A0A2G5UJY7_9PELO|nr:hypothetical protein B9Z55_011285 [Caenorhabditis nigoni]